MSVARNPHIKLYETGITDRNFYAKENPVETLFFGNCWDIEILKAEECTEMNSRETVMEEKQEHNLAQIWEAPAGDERNIEFEKEIRKKYFSKYPFYRAVKTPLKTSVSEIKRSGQENTDDYEGHSFLRGINITLKEIVPEENAPLDSARKGIAVHSFFRYADISEIMKNPSREKILSNMEKMHKLKIINDDEYQYLKEKSINFLNYYNSNLAETIYNIYKNNPGDIFTEMPFTLGVNSSILYGDEGFSPEDKTYTQGIIDCWYKKGGVGVLIAYKTDN